LYHDSPRRQSGGGELCAYGRQMDGNMEGGQKMPEHVLIVESDDRIRDAICNLFEMAEIRTNPTSTAAAAMIGLQSIPALMVIDLLLPDDDGMNVIRAVRELGMPTRVAVIASGRERQFFESARDLHPDAIFGRPFDFDDFSSWLSENFDSVAHPIKGLSYLAPAISPSSRFTNSKHNLNESVLTASIFSNCFHIHI
jgi:DNA-binding NarL/FixJ family response regulator